MAGTDNTGGAEYQSDKAKQAVRTATGSGVVKTDDGKPTQVKSQENTAGKVAARRGKANNNINSSDQL
jgi:hypothetical protein